MALDAAKLLLDSPDSAAKIAEVMKNPLHPDPTFSFFGIPVVVSDCMPPGKIAFVEEEPEKC